MALAVCFLSKLPADHTRHGVHNAGSMRLRLRYCFASNYARLAACATILKVCAGAAWRLLNRHRLSCRHVQFMPGGPSEKRGRQAPPGWGSKNVSRNTDLGKRFQPASGARGVKGDSHIWRRRSAARRGMEMVGKAREAAPNHAQPSPATLR